MAAVELKLRGDWKRLQQEKREDELEKAEIECSLSGAGGDARGLTEKM